MVNRRNLYHLWLTEFITIKYIKEKTSYPESSVKGAIFQSVNEIIGPHIFHRYKKLKAPKITYDSMPKNIEIKKLRETWIKSTIFLKNWLIHWMNRF